MSNRTRDRKRPTETKPKKRCSICKKEKNYTFFYKVTSSMFADGMINMCSSCVRDEVNVDDIDSVVSFLRQIDKPFIQRFWDDAVKSGKYPLGEYIRKLNSPNSKDKTFNDSDGFSGIGKVEAEDNSIEITNVKGEAIEFSNELKTFWGNGYSKEEYLQLEKFYQDMRLTHEIHTPIHVNLLKHISKLTVQLERLMQKNDWNNYNKLSKTLEDMTKSAGFRPVDRQGIDDATGIRSFAQIWEEVEKKGFRKPPKLEFDEDIVDGIIISLANYYHRLVGKQILSELPDDIKEDLDAFYELDETPVELNDEEYEDLDFSVEDDLNG